MSGDQGARVLFREFAEKIVQVDMPDDAVLVDIDTEGALETVRSQFADSEATQGTH